MNKVRKASTVLIVALLLVSSVGTTAYYFNNLLNDKNSKISSLQSQIENQTTEIAGLNNQISGLESELTNLTAPSAIINSITEDTLYPGAIAGMTTEIYFYVNVTNTGLLDIHNSTVTVHSIEGVTGTWADTENVPLLHPNETQRIVCFFDLDWNRYHDASSLNYLVTLSLNGTSLDTKTYYKSA